MPIYLLSLEYNYNLYFIKVISKVFIVNRNPLRSVSLECFVDDLVVSRLARRLILRINTTLAKSQSRKNQKKEILI